MFTQVSATAPDGTDAVLWVGQAADDQIAIRGRVRRPGTDTWVTVQAYVTDAAQDMTVVGDRAAQMTVGAATRPAGVTSTWTVDDVSAAGDGQSTLAAIGPDGTAAVTWNAPSTGSEIVRLAYRDVTSADSWVSTDLVTGPGIHRIEQPVVDEDGYITGFWWDGKLWARQVPH